MHKAEAILGQWWKLVARSSPSLKGQTVEELDRVWAQNYEIFKNIAEE